MRESNFSFPVQNRAAVVISSQLYDRRALDTTSPLPLFNSLTHLTYLTSTSPRIREILTIDGGLERLVRLLRDFCSHPPPPQSPRIIYGLKPAALKKRKQKGKDRAKGEAFLEWRGDDAEGQQSTDTTSTSTSDLKPKPNPLTSFDRFAAFRFSLAFQCVVNIGVRGSETVRARVVQAGMLDVVSSVLECWLVSKGFAVCPSPTGSGAPRESKEVRVARRMELLERRQRDQRDLSSKQLPSSAPGAQQQQSGSDGDQQQSRSSAGIVSIPVIRTARPPISGQSQRRTAPPADRTMIPVEVADGPSSASGSATSSADESRGPNNGADDAQMETDDDDSNARNLGRRDTIRASTSTIRPGPSPWINPQSTGESSISSTSASSSTSALTTLPVPIRRPPVYTEHSGSSGNVSDSGSADTSANATPTGGNTPTGSVTIEARERSGTVVARPVWDVAQQTQPSPSRRTHRHSNTMGSRDTTHRQQQHQQRDVETGTDDEAGTEAEERENDPALEAQNARAQQLGVEQHSHARMAVIVEADQPEGHHAGMDLNMIVDQGPLQGVGMGVGVQQGLVNLDMQANDDMAMGAPPGAPGAVQNIMIPTQTQTQQGGQGMGHEGATPRQTNEMTPRAAIAALTQATPTMTMNRGGTMVAAAGIATATPVAAGENIPLNAAAPTNQIAPTAATPAQAITAVQLALNGMSAAGLSTSGSPSLLGGGGADDQSAGPYREEDVLLSLQLLAYLSKYPHVRQAFYKTRIPLGPPLLPPKPTRIPIIPPTSHSNQWVHIAIAHAHSDQPPSPGISSVESPSFLSSKLPPPVSSSSSQPPQPIQHAPNVFSLVERFTFRPSPSELHLPRLPQEIQYWAGVIMRNACRKDETRGGIRQCANMVCGKLETFPREFAKCRRCRKAKYCGKECQSKAWADGHRFWCSSRDAEAADAAAAAQADGDGGGSGSGPGNGPNGGGAPSSRTRHRPPGGIQGAPGGTARHHHHHHHHHHHQTGSAPGPESASISGLRSPPSAATGTIETRPRSTGGGSSSQPAGARPSWTPRSSAALMEQGRALVEQIRGAGHHSEEMHTAEDTDHRRGAPVTGPPPRARITGHALPPSSSSPVASGTNTATQPCTSMAVDTTMDFDRRMSSSGQQHSLSSIRRRAGTLPTVLSQGVGPSSPSQPPPRADPGTTYHPRQQLPTGGSTGAQGTVSEYYDRATRELLRELEALRENMGLSRTADERAPTLPANERMEYANHLLTEMRSARDQLQQRQSVRAGRTAAAGGNVDEDGDDAMNDID
ncbi:hypothetical protein FRB96_007859 [Tulasnella sp. 330]|nr:hypothetical protein FRB96_007859 [Tulasnella sp. 330]KAG8877233.1 hypothetical protein FRB98_006818 [Tulasnella sp. 332]KAG8879151.1 hypothetical protein FRB97_001931 [Tulasnella sp. 331]